jgi:hypothetical protein
MGAGGEVKRNPRIKRLLSDCALEGHLKPVAEPSPVGCFLAMVGLVPRCIWRTSGARFLRDAGSGGSRYATPPATFSPPPRGSGIDYLLPAVRGFRSCLLLAPLGASGVPEGRPEGSRG